jgi:hypothetical protein
MQLLYTSMKVPALCGQQSPSCRATLSTLPMAPLTIAPRLSDGNGELGTLLKMVSMRHENITLERGDLLTEVGPSTIGDSARLLFPGQRLPEPLPYQYVNYQLGVSRITAGVAPVEVKAHKMCCVPCVRSPHEFRANQGRWDRNRTCILQFWSLLPFVHQRSPEFTSVGVNIGVKAA